MGTTAFAIRLNNNVFSEDIQVNGHVKIEPEELRFVYKLILEGHSDSDILNLYSTLNDMGKLNFPLRTENSFIQDRRVEMEIASEVLQDSIIKIIKPFIPKQRDEHYAQIHEISDILLQDNLNSIIERKSEAIYGFRSQVTYRPVYALKDKNNLPVQINRLQLIELIRKNVEKACNLCTYLVFYDYYLPHLKAEMPEMEAEGFWPIVENRPFDVITAIKKLAEQKELPGTCPLCGDIELQLPPLIKPLYNEICKI